MTGNYLSKAYLLPRILPVLFLLSRWPSRDRGLKERGLAGRSRPSCPGPREPVGRAGLQGGAQLGKEEGITPRGLWVGPFPWQLRALSLACHLAWAVGGSVVMSEHLFHDGDQDRETEGQTDSWPRPHTCWNLLCVQTWRRACSGPQGRGSAFQLPTVETPGRISGGRSDTFSFCLM